VTTPDVRVRLSAEGVAEVVGALQKIQAESSKVAAKQSKGFLGLNGVLGNTKNLLAGMGVALSVGAFTSWVKGSAEAADQAGKLAQKVGASTENLSALSLAARLNDVENQKLTQGLVLLNKRVAEAAEGNPQAAATFKNLGLSVNSFKGKDAAERFELVSQALSKMGAGYQKSKTAQDLFGRSGADLIPLMDQLAEEGLGRLIERARELGVLIDTDMAAAADQLGDDIDLLRLQAQGLGIQFATGVGPQISQALQIMSGDLSQTNDAWKGFGEGVGLVLKFVVGIVSSAFDLVGSAIASLFIQLDAGVRASMALMRGRVDEAKGYIRAAQVTMAQEGSALMDRLTGRFELVISAPTKPKAKDTEDGTADETDPAELVRRRAEASRAVLDNELAMVRLQSKLRNNAEKRSFEEGLTSVREYYRSRREIAAQETDQEVALLLKKRALLSAEPDVEKQGSEAAKIDTEIAKLRLEQQDQLASLTLEETRAVRELAKERLSMDQRMLESQGRTYEAALLGIEAEVAAADKLYRTMGGLSDAQRKAKVDSLRDSLTAMAHFNDVRSSAEAALDDLAAKRADIQVQADAGLISQFEAEQQILALETGRLKTLQDLATRLLAAAQAAGNPEAIAQAKAFAAAVSDIGVAAQGATDFLSRLKSTAIDASYGALTDFFDNGLQSAKNWKAGVRAAIASVIASLRRMASEAVAAQVMKTILSSFSAGGEVKVAKKADGGLLGGQGTGTSDSNLALVSRGEFIVRAAAVHQPGVLSHLEQLNRRGSRALMYTPALMSPPIAHFAGGGLVDGASAAAAAPSNGTLTVELAEGLIARYLESPAGQRIQIKNASNNRRAYQAALGR
jgi:hypothetical protein